MFVITIVSLSNLYGMVIFSNNLSVFQSIFFSNVILASILMHLSEKKHKLPGVFPFNKYSSLFLWYDRIMAQLATSYILYNLYSDYIHFNGSYSVGSFFSYLIGNNNLASKILSRGLIGLFFLWISENVHSIGKYGFMVSHSLWHFFAFDIIMETVRYVNL